MMSSMSSADDEFNSSTVNAMYLCMVYIKNRRNMIA